MPLPDPAPAVQYHATANPETAEAEPAAFSVDERGMICDCNGVAEKLFGYRRSELVWRHVSTLLPQLAEGDLVRDGEIDPRLHFLCHSGRSFEAIHNDGARFPCELFIIHLRNPGKRNLRLVVRPAAAA